MIIDTSALLAIYFGESEAGHFSKLIVNDTKKYLMAIILGDDQKRFVLYANAA